MYAKLRFKNGSTGKDVNRAIVKAITDCYTAPASVDLTGYPAVDSSFCEFYSTDSSHWTFAGGGTLGSDSAEYSSAQAWHGSQYTLKCSYDTGHIVYADMRLSGNEENSNIYNATNFAIMPTPRNRFGTALEDLQLGNTSQTTAASSQLRDQGVSTYHNKEIHVFADQTKLVLAGTSNYLSSRPVIIGLYQFNQTNAMKYRDTIKPILDSNVPSCWTYWSNGDRGNTDGNGTAAYRDARGWADEWDDNSEKSVLVHFPGNIYNEKNGVKLRNASINPNSLSDDILMSLSDATVDDDTTARPTTQTNTLRSNLTNPERYLSGFYVSDWGAPYSRDADAWDAVSGNAWNLDSNGNKEIPLKPIRMDFSAFAGNEVDMSQKAGIYRTLGNAGFWGDSAEINGSKYQYFPLSSNGALFIRRD